MRKASQFVRVLQLLVVGLALSPGGDARADTRPTLTGRWEAGPLRVKLSLQGWTKNCGEPPSEAGDGGGFVDVRQTATELWIYGHDRPFSTSSCWEHRSGLSTVGHSPGTRSWSSTCSGSSADSTVTVRSAVSATDDTIRFTETSDYEFERGGQTCTATAHRSRTYHLVERRPASAARPATEAAVFELDDQVLEAVAPTKDVCSRPGPATILTVTPARELVPQGGSVRFEVSAMDANGCRVADPALEWQLPDVDGLRFTDGRTLELGPQVPEGPLVVSATLLEMKRDVRLRVVSQERFDALLAARSVARGGHEPPTTIDAPASVTAGVAVAEDRARRRKYLFALIAAATATLLGALGTVIMRRARHNPEPKQAAVHYSTSARRDMAAETRRICPTCGSMYGTEAEFCGKDGSFLVQAN